MKYRIKPQDYFIQHARENSEKIYVPVTSRTKSKLFNRKMNKYCNQIIDTEIQSDQDGHPCIMIRDIDNGQWWYFYEGWFEEVKKSNIRVRRGGYKSKGFQLCFIE